MTTTAASRPASTFLVGWISDMGAWVRRRRERHVLLSLDPRTLHDLGLTRADIEGACAVPFREALDYAELEARRRYRSRGSVPPSWLPAR